jgi:hypothetical protein
MARFSLKRPIKLVVRGASTSVIPNPQGIPVAVNMPAKTVEIKSGIYDTTDQEIIERIRRDIHYNTPDGIIEISEDDIEAATIKEKKMKEADAEIKEMKKRGRPKAV